MLNRRQLITGLSAACMLPALPKIGPEKFEHIEIIRIEVEDAIPALAFEGEYGHLVTIDTKVLNQDKEEFFQTKLKNVAYFKDTFAKQKYCYFVSVKNMPDQAGFVLSRDKVTFMSSKELVEIISKSLREPVMT